jgi:hypothetical protein
VIQKHLETCRCGKVKLEAVGRPILTASCYCASCQEAGRRFEQLPAAPPVLNADGGTDYLLYRKDRVHCVAGQEHLEEHRLKPESPTRRVLATCCNSAMFADFTKGHWLTIYRNRFAAGAPPVEVRVMTRDRRDGAVLADGVPSSAGYPARFMVSLIAAWIAMGFRRPEIPWGKTVGKSP